MYLSNSASVDKHVVLVREESSSKVQRSCSCTPSSITLPKLVTKTSLLSITAAHSCSGILVGVHVPTDGVLPHIRVDTHTCWHETFKVNQELSALFHFL